MQTPKNIRNIVLMITAMAFAASPGYADFCFDQDDAWLENGATGKGGYWEFEPGPSAMAPNRIPITCFQRNIQFSSGSKLVFSDTQKTERNRMKCERAIGQRAFSWNAGYSDAYADWGIEVIASTSEAGQEDASLFFFADCTVVGDVRRLVLSAEVLDGKIGDVQYVWRVDPNDG